MVLASWLNLLAVGLAFQPNARPDAQQQHERVEVVKVLIWYSKGDPLKTFSYRVYNAHNPEKVAAAEQWIRLVHERYPAYEAYLRPFDLTLVPGENDDAKVAGLLSRELMVIAVYYYGLDFSQTLGRGPGSLGPPARPLRPLPPMHPSPGFGARPNPSYGAPSSFPFPYPYVRPHP